MHWHHFDQPIVPPILPFINRNNNKPISKKILVYLPFEDLNDIVELLKPFKDNSFYVYHDIEKPKTIGNINLKPFSRSGFEDDLLSSEKVLCNAGFELPSESLILGKNNKKSNSKSFNNIDKLSLNLWKQVSGREI